METPISLISTAVSIGGHYLYPANLFVEKEHYLVTTILGSCIAVCLYDPKNKIGGINHFMLPFWNGDGLASVRFGNIAMEKLIGQMLQHGSEKNFLKGKIFGGANQSNFSMRIGDRNAEIARKSLDKNKISIVAENIGGNSGRKIIFDTHTGVVKMKYIKSNSLLKQN